MRIIQFEVRDMINYLTKRQFLAGLLLICLVVFSACGKNQAHDEGTETASESPTQTTEVQTESVVETESETESSSGEWTPVDPLKGLTYQISNLADEESRQEVTTILKKYLPADSVDGYMNCVKTYYKEIGDAGFTKGFADQKPEYDMDVLYSPKKGAHSIGTNCRLNLFQLLQANLQIPEISYDDTHLFMDKEANEEWQLFDEANYKRFCTLFTQLETETTTEEATHAKIAEQYYKGITFDNNVRALFVVLHDNLDGDHLFIGHTGVLVKLEDGRFLFLEKLSFEDPYQAFYFTSEQDAYAYLKYAYSDGDTTTADAMIFDNGIWVK